MDLQTDRQGDIVIITLTGELGSQDYRLLDGLLDDMARSGAHKIILDFQGLSYLTTIGITVLIKFQKAMDRIRGRMVLVNLPAPMQETLRLTRLDGVFEIQPDTQTALGTLTGD